MLRKIININEDICDGCGNCIPECHEGALQIIDGKARLISDLFCDGLGACLGHCPTNALTIVEREAIRYDEKKVMNYIAAGGLNVIKAHLKHLRDHEEFEYLSEALEYLRDNKIDNPLSYNDLQEKRSHGGCPGSQEISIENIDENANESGVRASHLRQWPIQLHLVSPHAVYFRNSDLLLAADCCGFACPKLDTNKQIYLDKLVAMIKESNLRSITVLIMQVPCCSGLAQLAQQAIELAENKIPLNITIISPTGMILQTI